VYYENAEKFKESNGYEINNIWYPRVTKIVAIKSKPGLDIFLKEIGDYALAENVKNKSAEEGSLVHNTIERLVLGEEIEVPEKIKPAVVAFQEFNEDRKIIFDPRFIELRFWSSRHRYAGTIDALVTIDGKFGVLDIKTSSGFWPEYNLQTAAYLSALQEFDIKRALTLPKDIETRWILRVDQHRSCKKCGATLREKGGRSKVKNSKRGLTSCGIEAHKWEDLKGEVELKEFPYFYRDLRAFMAAKILWEWESDYWLRRIGYLR